MIVLLTILLGLAFGTLAWFIYELIPKKRYKGTESGLSCSDCGTTENVGESGFCASCEETFDEILESMNDVEEDDEEP